MPGHSCFVHQSCCMVATTQSDSCGTAGSACQQDCPSFEHYKLLCCHVCSAAEGQDTPGPLDYCPDPKPLLPSAPCYTIAGRTAASAAAAAAGCDSPGPGDYEVGAQQSGLSQGPAWTLGARVAAAGASGCDSPGKNGLQHHANTCWHAQRGFGATHKGCRQQSAAWRQQEGGSWLFARANAGLLCVAGPGEYHRPQYPGADGPAFSLAGRLPSSLTAADTALLPGPGHYEVPAAPSGAAFTIAGRLQTVPEQQDMTPGPGGSLRSCAC